MHSPSRPTPEYSEEGFWHKVSSVARKAGQTALNPALRMYFAAQDSDTPVWARTTIYGALGYFISPSMPCRTSPPCWVTPMTSP